MSRPLHILFLPSWYPVKNQELNGIFNRELAELISGPHQVSLLHLHFDNSVSVLRLEENQPNPNFKEIIAYLPGKGNSLVRQWRYFRIFFMLVRRITTSYGKVNVAHVQVAWKMGLMAWLLRIRWGIPYLVTEHYTGYLPADGALRGWKKRASIFLLKQAEWVTAVGPGLQEALLSSGVKNVRVIANRVDAVFFQADIPMRKEKEAFTFLHVSNFDDRQKQTSAIIRQFAKLHSQYPNTHLNLLVPAKKWEQFRKENAHLDIQGMKQLSPDNNRQTYVQRMQMADALVSFSYYETFGLTIAEALCLGIPVIYTACGGPEFFVEAGMGEMADAKDENSLFSAMEKIMHRKDFDPADIAARAREKMSSEKILAQYNEVYYSMTNR